jgi:hypothetical protein
VQSHESRQAGSWLIFDVRQKMPAGSTILIDDIAVDPRVVVASPETRGMDVVRIEVRLPSSVVLHELRQSCDPALTSDQLRAFLVSDARDFRARAAYLAIARAVAGFPSDQEIASPKRWSWSNTTEVTEREGVIRFFGGAVAL